MRRTIRLNESELKQMIAESVKRVVNEWDEESINPEVDELIQKTIEKLPGKAIHADAYVVPKIFLGV